ncbi:MAG: type II secretion system F family protein, partial [Candidatus Microthrix sp.]
MDEAFDQLTDYIKRDLALTRQVRKALIYPCILLAVAIGVCLIIVVFAIPRFATFFEDFDAELPLPTRMLMAVSDFVGSTAGLITGVVAVAVIIGL